MAEFSFVNRWNSTFDMLVRVTELKEFCMEMSPGNQELSLNEEQWEEIAQVIDSLRPPKEAMTYVQGSQVTVGDFFLSWMRCKVDLCKKSTDLAKILLENMNEREEALMETDCFRSAMFMDPRYFFFCLFRFSYLTVFLLELSQCFQKRIFELQNPI